MRLTSLEQQMSSLLGIPLKICRADTAPPAWALSAGERQKLATLASAQRRRDWLAGREALKSLLRTLGRADDTTRLKFPDPGVSLTHSDGSAIAVASPRSSMGIGIDFEMVRAVKLRMADWFLNNDELTWLKSQLAGRLADDFVRLWTIKEAAFKAHPRNSRLALVDLVIRDPAPRDVYEVVARDHLRIDVVAQRFESGYLSVGVAQEAK